MVESRQGELEGELLGKRQKVRRRDGNRPELSPNKALAKALSHPLRARALTILADRMASPKEISMELDAPLANVSYHVGVLRDLGLIEIKEVEPVRGAVAHYYEAVQNLGFDDDSLSIGLLDEPTDRQAERTLLVLDQQGFKKASKILRRAHASLLKEQAASEERLREKPATPMNAIVETLLFEAPAPARFRA